MKNQKQPNEVKVNAKGVMGRPRNRVPYKKCSFQLDQDLYDEYAKFCEKNCISKTLLFNKIVSEFLEKAKKNGTQIL